jgi:immune inhibitor A
VSNNQLQITTLSRVRPLTRLTLVVTAFFTLILLGCSTEWSFGEALDRAERPAATSTPHARVAVSPALVPSRRESRPAPGTEPQLAMAAATPNLAEMSLEEQLAHVVIPTRDLRDLALRLNPIVDDIPLVINEQSPDYAVGERLEFWVHNLDTAENIEITAELIHKTDVAYAWVEVGEPTNRQAIARAVNTFSEQTYPALTEFFGSEWNPGVDNDPRLHILHSSQLGSGIAGYYSSSDQYSRLANAYSNEKEMFYISLSIIPASGNTIYYETVLAHEFQHMIHWYQDRNEETWVNEGLSEYAQEVAGYAPDTQFASEFANRPHTQLNTWSEEQGSNGPHYGAAYLFVAYFAQRFGPEMTRALVASPANGIQGFNEVLELVGLGPDDENGGGYGFNGLLADWVVANYVDDPYAYDAHLRAEELNLEETAFYGYLNFSQLAPALHARHQNYPVDPPPDELPNYATHYLLLKGEGDVVFHFLGEVDTVLAQAEWLTSEEGRHRAWWSNRGDDFNPRLTRAFDLRQLDPDEDVELFARMWWEIEEHYDFGYVVACTTESLEDTSCVDTVNGPGWDVLEGDYTTTEDPVGAAFGPGYTGRSVGIDDAEVEDGWVVDRFDLSDYVGEVVWIRFEYVTDDAVTAGGWFVDEVQIPALDYAEDFMQEDFLQDGDGWLSEGWLLTDNRLEQHWLLQVLHLEDNRLTGLERYTADEEGRIQAPISGLGDGRTAVIAISPTTPITTVPAPYAYHIELQE